MSFDMGAMIEPVAVAVHASKKFAKLDGSKVAVLGCGPIGILVAQVCKALGAKEVLITDVSQKRLQIAKSCNIDHTINTKDKDFGEALLECFGNDRADVIYDCAGNDVTIGQAIKYSRKGSSIILVAICENIAKVDLATLNDKELILNSSMMYRHDDYITAISLVEQGKVSLKQLMTVHFKFTDYQKAYQYIDENKELTMKVLIDVDN